MGKGGGRGRGKGGCECFEAMHAFACCVCLVLIGGPILIAIGASILAAATRNDRAHNIDAVQAAVNAWTDPASPASWQQFRQLSLFAELRPGSGLSATAAAACGNISAALQADTRALDVYTDEAARFQGVPQFRFTLGGLDHRDFFLCQRQVTLLQRLPNATFNSTLAVLPAAADPTTSYSIQIDKAVGPNSCPTRSDTCGFGTNYRNCRANCEDYFGATFSCTGGVFNCYLRDAFFNNFAIKVAYRPASGGSPAAYAVDFNYPGLGGGGNAMPAGFIRQFSPGNFSGGPASGPVFQLRNISSPDARPAYFSVTVRSSSDPWLAYMAATGGSGYFGITKATLVASGVVLLVVGCLGTLLWCVALFYAWRMLCARNRPTARPQGVVGGYAWDLANRYGGSYAPAIGVPVHGTGPDGMPTAQPLYAAHGAYSHDATPGQPAHGYPYPYAYPYPPPHGSAPPPHGGYPAYPAPPPYPPGSSVEMAQYPYGFQVPPPAAAAAQQGYGYPPPPPGAQPSVDGAAATGGVGGDAGATAAYSYPYAYPYPPYGQSPAAAGAAAPAPPPTEAGSSMSAAAAPHGHSGAGPSGSNPGAPPPPGVPKY